MAGPPGFAVAAAAIETVAKSVRDGSLAWTPGLGDRIQSAGWLAQFRQRVAPLIGVKRGSASGPSTVDLITGATISSRAVVGAVNRSAAKWDPLLRARLAGGEQ